MFDAYTLQSFSKFCGGTPSEEYAFVQVVVNCKVRDNDIFLIAKNFDYLINNYLNRSSARESWLSHIKSEKLMPIDENPLCFYWRTLQLAFPFSDYPSKVKYLVQDDGGLSIDMRSFSPYDVFFKHSIKIILFLLNLSVKIIGSGSVNVKLKLIESLNADFEKLNILIPPQTIRVLHRNLWEKRIAWEWLGNQKNRIGVGINQRFFLGAADHYYFDDPLAWRIPIYTITGSVGKTTTTRLLWQLLQNTGKTLALAVSDGAWIGTRKVSDGDCIGGRTAQALLKSRVVEGAVFEQGRGGLIKQGVPYAQSDIAILLNVQSVHLGLDGIDTLEKMADTKLAGLRPARIWVLNRDDAQCRRISAQHAANETVWFSVTANLGDVQILSKASLGVLCVARDEDGEPVALCIFQDGHEIKRMDLSGVAPYHGMLGEKTLEELLAAVAAAWFGPLHVSDWSTRLSTLRLDNSNHTFRTSIHRQGQVIFVLDKAAERASLTNLKQVMQELAAREGCQHTIAVLTRSAGETPERHQESAQVLHSFMDEFVCFDRPETYTTSHALPVYRPGSIPTLLKTYFDECNNELGVNKPVVLAEDWAAAQKYLFQKLSKVTGKTLVLINQPGTGLTELNQQILAFANAGLTSNPN